VHRLVAELVGRDQKHAHESTLVAQQPRTSSDSCVDGGL